jgi:hypothetical protein
MPIDCPDQCLHSEPSGDIGASLTLCADGTEDAQPFASSTDPELQDALGGSSSRLQDNDQDKRQEKRRRGKFEDADESSPWTTTKDHKEAKEDLRMLSTDLDERTRERDEAMAAFMTMEAERDKMAEKTRQLEKRIRNMPITWSDAIHHAHLKSVVEERFCKLLPRNVLLQFMHLDQSAINIFCFLLTDEQRSMVFDTMADRVETHFKAKFEQWSHAVEVDCNTKGDLHKASRVRQNRAHNGKQLFKELADCIKKQYDAESRDPSDDEMSDSDDADGSGGDHPAVIDGAVFGDGPIGTLHLGD